MSSTPLPTPRPTVLVARQMRLPDISNQVDPNVGSAFGLAIESRFDDFVFATVDDTTAVLDIREVRR